MEQFQIETAQNISIDQNTAHVGDRMLAYIIDSFVIGVYMLLTILLLVSMEIDFEDMWAIYLVLNLPAFLYYVLLETFMNGKTIGKSLMHIRVVKIDGSKPNFASYLVRWLLRIVDVVLTSGGLAVLTILVRGKGQRIGDMAAGTTVISEKKRITLKDTVLRELPTDYQPRFPQVTIFKDSEMQTISELYDTAKQNGDHQVMLRLNNQIKRVMNITSEMKPFEFVDVIIKDYNFFTQQF